jgi:hypothetical protein
MDNDGPSLRDILLGLCLALGVILAGITGMVLVVWLIL